MSMDVRDNHGYVRRPERGGIPGLPVGDRTRHSILSEW
jgi:hypothetical protein